MANVQLIFSLISKKRLTPLTILLNKLYDYGIMGVALEWFKNYMPNRYQVVKHNDYKSEARKNIVRSPTGVYFRPTFIPDLYSWFTYGL